MEALDEDDLPGFATQVKIAQEIGSNFEELYGVESGNKTILHLALEEDDGLPYCEELIKVKTVLHVLITVPFYNNKNESSLDKKNYFIYLGWRFGFIFQS